jgi:hypothetical protein
MRTQIIVGAIQLILRRGPTTGQTLVILRRKVQDELSRNSFLISHDEFVAALECMQVCGDVGGTIDGAYYLKG